MKAERLEQEFADRSVVVRRGAGVGAPLLLRVPDAIELVARAADEGVPIVGVDGLRATDTEVERPVERLADFSSQVAQGHGCWQEAEEFILGRGDSEMLFGLTLGDDPIEIV